MSTGRGIVLAVVCGLSLVVAVVASLFGSNMSELNSNGGTTYSWSALGHRALVEVLDDLDIPVVRSRHRSASKASVEGLLVLAEPVPEPERFRFEAERVLEAIAEAHTTLLVMPRRIPHAHDETKGWVEPTDVTYLRESRALLTALGLPNVRLETTVGGVAPDGWQTQGLGPAPDLPDPRLFVGPGIDPVIAHEAGALVVATAWKGRRLYLLSDPDLMATHGLARPGNAELVVGLLNNLRGSGRIVMDETLHGYVIEPSFWRSLLRFPLVLLPLHVAICLVLLLWAALGRFGAPQMAAPAPPGGAMRLVSQTATLLGRGGASWRAADRYTAQNLRAVRGRLHVPRDLRGSDLAAHLDRLGSARGMSTSWATLAERLKARDGGDAGALAFAREVHRWRGEMTHGT